MIDAYVWTTPNGYKALILLEELGLPYTIRWINIMRGDQSTPEYLAINPNNKIPAIVDQDTDVTVFESGAIAIYLAEKTRRLLAPSGPDRSTALEWTFFNVGGTGPMVGQLGHFVKVATGLARPDFFDWPAYLEEDMANRKPPFEVVLVMRAATWANGSMLCKCLAAGDGIPHAW